MSTASQRTSTLSTCSMLETSATTAVSASAACSNAASSDGPNPRTPMLTGEQVDPDRHQLAVEAKGATVTALKVVRGQDGQWVAECVIDV